MNTRPESNKKTYPFLKQTSKYENNQSFVMENPSKTNFDFEDETLKHTAKIENKIKPEVITELIRTESIKNNQNLKENQITIVEFYDILFGRDCENDYKQELCFNEIQDDYEFLIQRNIYKDPFFLCLKEKPSIKSLLMSANELTDQYPYLKLRRYFLFGINLCSYFVKKMVSSILFEFFTLALLMIQIYTLMEEKRVSNYFNPNIMTINYINMYFGIELILKIFAFGFYFNKNSFMKKPIIIYDSIIILHDLSCYFFSLKNEIWLFPLRCITFINKLKIMELQKILMSIFLSLKLTGQVLFVVLLFCYIYSLFGLYLFSGLFKKSCFYPPTGFADPNGEVCGNIACPIGLVCGKLISSQYDVGNFDNLLLSFMMVLRILALDSWNSVQNLCQQTFTNYIWIYFLSFIILGNFFLINIFLAVENISYSKVSEKTKETLKEKEVEYNLKEFKFENDENENSPQINHDKDKIRKYETMKPSSFNTKKSRTKISKGKEGSQNNSKDYPSKSSKLSKQENLFKKITQKSQKIPEVSSSENSKPSTKLYDFEKNILTLEKETPTEVVNEKKKGLIKMKKMMKCMSKLEKIIKCIYECCLKMTAAFIERVTRTELEFLDSKNLTISVMENKKYYGLSSEDVLPLKKETKLIKMELKQKMTKIKKIILKYDIENYLETHFKTKLSLGAPSHKKKNLSLLKKNKSVTIQTKIPLPHTSHRSKMIKKSFITQKMTKHQQKTTLSMKQVSLSKFSKVVPAKNIAQKSLKSKMKQMTSRTPTDANKAKNMTSDQRHQKKNIDTNLYVDVSSLTYEKIVEIINLEIEDEFKKDLNYRKMFLKIKENDLKRKTVDKEIWSGENVLASYVFTKQRILSIFKALNETFKNLKYYKNSLTILKAKSLQKRIKNLVISDYFHYFFATFTFCSTINFSLEGILDDNTYNQFYEVSTIFFTIESALKLAGLGPLDYLRSKENVLDLIITIYMILYNLTDQINEITVKIPSFRMVRAFIIFRALKIFKGFSFFEVISFVMKKSFFSFLYITLLIFLFLFILSLVGFQIFYNLLTNPQFTTTAKTFNSLSESFMSVFDIMTLDNLFAVYYAGWNQSNNFYLTGFYVVIIFIGNMFLLNLFIALLLAGFGEITEQEEEANLKIGTINSIQSIYEEEDFSNLNLSNNQSILSDATKKSPMKKTASLSSKNEKKFSFQKSITFFDEDYEKIEEENSLFLFSKENFIRIMCYKLSNNVVFKTVINITIIFSIVYMALLTFNPTVDDEQIGVNIKITINSFMMCESTATIINHGFIMRKNSFMRNIFNIADLAVIIVFFLDTCTSLPNSINVLYIIRVVRIYKLLYSIKEIKIIMDSLILSLTGLLSLAVFVIFTWSIFAMIGIILFRGRFGYCGSQNNYYVGIDANNQWIIAPLNFENIYEAFFSLFEVATFDNWSSLIQSAVDSSLAEYGPIPNNNQYSAYVFFISFVVIGVYFCMNLFIGVLCSNFNEVKKLSQNKYLNTNQIKWIEMQKKIMNAEPKLYPPPTIGFRKTLNSFLNSSTFTRFIQLIMILNIISCSLFYDEESSKNLEMIDLCTYFITFIYLIEMLLKMMVFGMRGYFSYSELKFQFLITFAMVINLMVAYGLNSSVLGEKLTRLLLILKVFGVLRIIGELPNIKNMLTVVIFSWKYILNIMVLMISSFIIFAIIGCNLFPNVETGNVVNDYVNFKNFFYGLQTLFKCATGDDWGDVSLDLGKTPPNCQPNVDCGSSLSPLFFVIFMLWTTVILQNLFIMAIFDTFEDYFVNKDKAFELVSTKISQFQMLWPLYCNKGTMDMNVTKLFEFFKALGPPLGFRKQDRLLEMGRSLMQMNILSSDNGNFHFNLLLYGSLKHHFYDEIFSDIKRIETLKILKSSESRFYLSLEKKILKQARTDKRRTSKFQKHGNPFSPYNPLPLLLISSLLFQKWKNYVTTLDKHEKKHKSKKSKPEVISMMQKSKFSIDNKTDLVEYKFEKMNITNVAHKVEKTLEKLEFEKEKDYPNYPCTKKNDNNLIND